MSVGTLSHSVNNITVNVPGGYFNDIQVDLYGVYDQAAGGGFAGTGSPCSLAYQSPTQMCDPMNVTITFTNGTTVSLQLTGLNTAFDGNNPFSYKAPTGEDISNVMFGGLTFDTQAKFYALSDLELSGPTLLPAPEPGTVMLLGAGLMALRLKHRLL